MFTAALYQQFQARQLYEYYIFDTKPFHQLHSSNDSFHTEWKLTLSFAASATNVKKS